MAAYGGITIYVLAQQEDNTIVRPDWDVGMSNLVVRTRIPYADSAYVQRIGRMNFVLKLKCEVYSDADYASLKAQAGDMVPRTLTDVFGDGTDYTGVLLQSVDNGKRVTFGTADWTFDCEFERQA